MSKKFICPVCGYVYEGDTMPEKCPICGKQMQEVKEDIKTWARCGKGCPRRHQG